MENNDKKEFAQIMTAVAENFGAEISKPGMAMRFEILKGYPMHSVRESAMTILRQRKYMGMPPVGEFISAIEQATNPTLPAEEQALLQANTVIKDIEGTWYDDAEALDEVTKRLMSRGRFSREVLCKTLMVDEYKWFIRDFVDAYLAMRMKVENDRLAPRVGPPSEGAIDRRQDLVRITRGIVGNARAAAG